MKGPTGGTGYLSAHQSLSWHTPFFSNYRPRGQKNHEFVQQRSKFSPSTMILTGCTGDGHMLPIIHVEGTLNNTKYLHYLDT